MAHFLPNQAKLDDFRTIQGPAKPVRTRDEQGFMVMDSVIVRISHALRNSYKEVNVTQLKLRNDN